MKRLFIAAVLLLTGFALATTWQVLELEEMLQAADTGFHGTVSDVRTELRDGQPWTLVSFRLEPDSVLAPSLLEEEIAPGSITLAFLGGNLAAEQLMVEGMPIFTTGEEVLVLAHEEQYYSPLIGFSQGLWRLQDGMWQADDGSVLTLDEDGDLQVAEAGESDGVATRLLELLGAR